MEDPEEEQVDEQSLDEELAGHGIVEPEMSLKDKRELLAVFKVSESTALEEENDRVGVQSSRPSRTNVKERDVKANDFPQQPGIMTVEKVTAENVPLFLSPDPSSINNKVLSESDSDQFEPSQPKSSKSTPKVCRLSLKGRVKVPVNTNQYEERNQSDMIAEDIKSLQFPNTFDDGTKSDTDVCEKNDSLCLKNNQLQLHNKVLSKEDKKRNINIFFNSEECPSESPLIVCKQPNAVGKVPYYYVPRGMNLKDFTAYFKKQLGTIAQDLVATQRRSLNFIQWGEPVVVSIVENKDDSLDEICGKSADENICSASQNQRYNFRGRSSKRKCTDDIFSFSTDEDSSNDDQLFSKKDTKASPKPRTNPYAGVVKRKSIFNSFGDHLEENCIDLKADKTSSNKASSTAENNCSSSEDEFLMIDQEKESNFQLKSKSRPLKERVNKNHSPNPNDMDDDSEQETVSIYDNKLPQPTSKISISGKRKKGRKLLSVGSNKNLSGGSGPSTSSVWLNTMSFEEPQEETIIIKPGPVNVKMRKLTKTNLSTDKTQKKVLSNTQEIDTKYEANDDAERVQSTQNYVACPICKQMFKSTEVEIHADKCINEDLISVENLETHKCPICQESFISGFIFENHTSQCQMTRRLVPPPPPPGARSRNKR